MSDLIIAGLGTGPCASIVPEPIEPGTGTVENDGWLPNIEIDHFRRHMRVRDQIPVDRLRDAIRDAIIATDKDLDAWRARQTAASLAAVSPRQLDGESRLVILYRRAVYARAKADLVERYRDIDTSREGDRRVDALDPTIADLQRDAAHAVRDLIGRPRVLAELI